jgi:hexosaminidase
MLWPGTNRATVTYFSGLLTILIVASVAVCQPNAADSLAVFPRPQQVQLLGGEVRITTDSSIAIEQGREDDRFAASLLRDAIKEICGEDIRLVELAGGTSAPPNAIIIGDPSRLYALKQSMDSFRLEIGPSVGTEGYQLYARGDRVLIAGNTSGGIFYGVQTLIQMVRESALKSKALVLPSISIIDWPSLSLRWYADDIARGQVPTLDELKKTVRFLGETKVNCYGLYLEDMFQFGRHPDIGKGRGALSKDEVRELVAYARRYHIDVVPEFETLGHMDHILSLPAYQGFEEIPGKPYLLSPVKPGVYQFLGDLLHELDSTFQSQYLVVGTDEALDLGKGATKSEAERMGLSNVWISHVKKLRETAEQDGKTLIVPFDMFDEQYYKNVFNIASPFKPEDVNRIPRDILPVVGNFAPIKNYAALQWLKSSGFTPIALAGLANWTRLFPRNVLARANMRAMAQAAYQQGAKGLTFVSFGDLGADDFYENNWYGIGFGADVSWNSNESADADFDRAFFLQYYGDTQEQLKPVYDLLSTLDDYFPAPRGITSPSVENFRIYAWPWLYLWIYVPPPRLYEFSPAELQKLRDLDVQLRLAKEQLRKARSHVQYHTASLDYLEFALDLSHHLVQRMLLSDTAARLEKEGKKAEAVATLAPLPKELDGLSERFKELWLRTNRPEGLAANLERFSKISGDYRQLIVQIGQ